MRWDLSFKRQALGDPVSEGRRVWEWIQQIRPLHPSLDLWRPTADSPQEAEQEPPITQDRFLQRIQQAQVDWESESFGVAPAPRTASSSTSATPKPPPTSPTSA